MNTIFLSHPVTDYATNTGRFRSDRQNLLERAIKELEKAKNCVVECAGLNEDFGRIKLNPSEFTAFDIEALERCTEFVMVSTVKPTRDMYLELGIALGRRVHCTVFLPSGTRITYMLIALSEAGQIDLVHFENENELPSIILEHFERKVED